MSRLRTDKAIVVLNEDGRYCVVKIFDLNSIRPKKNCILLLCTSIRSMYVGYFSLKVFATHTIACIYIYTTRTRLYSYARKNVAIVRSNSISIGFFTVRSSRLEFPVYRPSPVCRYCFLSDICLVFFPRFATESTLLATAEPRAITLRARYGARFHVLKIFACRW